jgi:RHS repeat-associated protein
MRLDWGQIEVVDDALAAVLWKYTWGLDLAGQSGGTGVSPGNVAADGSSAGLEAAGTIGGLLAMEQPLQIRGELNYVYLYDANGNVGQVIDLFAANAPASIKAHYEYDPYGKRTNAASPAEYDQPWRFSTKQFDPETGLGYWGARYYDPRLGRWMSSDPLEESAGPNLYAYVGNRPTDGVDPLGTYWLINPGGEVKQRKACCTCRYDIGYDQPYCQREVRCPGSARSPEECCQCCSACGKGSLRAGAGTLEFAEWGSCCFCTVRVKRDLWAKLLPHHGFEMTCPKSKYGPAFTLTVDRDMAETNSLWGPAKVYCGDRPYSQQYMPKTIAESRVSCWRGYRLKMEIESAYPLSCSARGYDYSMDRFPFQQCRSFAFGWYYKASPTLEDCPSSWYRADAPAD